MGFGIFFHDFHMSGSGIRSHTFATMKTKQIQTSNFGGSHLYGCHRHVANKTNSCSQVCAVFVSTKCTPNKKSQYFEYWKNIISIKFFGFCGFSHKIFIYRYMYTRTIFKPHPKYTIRRVFFSVVAFHVFFSSADFFFGAGGGRESEERVVRPGRLNWGVPVTGSDFASGFVSLGGTPDFPKTSIRQKNPSENIGEGVRFSFQGVCGWDFETQILPWFATPVRLDKSINQLLFTPSLQVRQFRWVKWDFPTEMEILNLGKLVWSPWKMMV